MTTPIVLIEISNGFVEVYADKNILVAIHDRDTEGNDLGRIDRENNETAFVKLTEKLDGHSATGANEALEVFESRITTDWGKEAARLAEMQGKAIAYLTEKAKEFGHITFDWITWSDGDNPKDFNCLEYTDGDVVICQSRLTSTQRHTSLCFLDSKAILDVASEVQKAIAGGAGK